MKNELARVDPQEFGLQETQVKDIEKAFEPKIKECEGYVKVYESVINKEINEQTCKEAGELRRKLVKVRTGIKEIHRTQKAFFLAAGRFVDAWRNKETKPVEQMEENLEQIEKHYEIQEQKRLDALQAERVELLSAYVEDAEERDLKNMEQDVWSAYLAAKKKEYEDRIEAEKQADRERIERERLQKLHNDRKNSILDLWQFIEGAVKEQDFSELNEADWNYFVNDLKKKKADYDKEQERIRKENERLQKEREEQERKAKIEQEKREKAEVERIAKEKAERKRREEKERKEREAYEAKLKKEREERERIQREIEKQKERERKEAEEAEAKRQAELKKGDADKVKDLIADIEGLKNKYTFDSEINKKMYKDVIQLFDKVIGYIKK